MTKPLIGVVTVLYNSSTVLNEFFSSLNLQTYTNLIVYVIDNKSQDNSLQMTRELAQGCKFNTVIIEHDKNYGVAKGNNTGIERALQDGCDMILLSNNDVTLLPDTIEKLLTGLEDQHAAMAVPKIYYHGTDQIWTAGGRFIKWRGVVAHIGALEHDCGQYDERRPVGYAPTCFMLIRKDVFGKVGLMDETYFVYWDDTDFVFRALKQGEILWYIPDSALYHKENTSTGTGSKFQIYYMRRNLVYFSLKNYSSLYAAYVILVNVAEHVLRNVFSWEQELWKTGINGYLDGFKIKRS
jgi:GT2 family glycosyltransferase